MNPSSYSTLMETDPAEGRNLIFPVNAVCFTPIFTEDHGVLLDTTSFLLEDHSTHFNDVFPDKHPMFCSSYDLICNDDLPVSSCMLSPQLEHVFQDYYTDFPPTQSLCPNSSIIAEAVAAPMVLTNKNSAPYFFSKNPSDDLQFLEVGVKETDQKSKACAEKPKEKGARRKRSRSTISSSTTVINNKISKLFDLRTLLIQCAEAVGSNDFRNANDFLMQIRSHSSPSGNASQRKAHYFANALEARLAGTGSQQYAALASKTILNSNISACRLLISASCPFIKLSNFFATEMIIKLAILSTTRTIHIIHFGFPHGGLQWTELIKRLSTIRHGNTNSPLMLRVTGTGPGDFLANCCRKFNVPFEYNYVAKKWETVQLKDLKLDRKNEVIVVNCLYSLRHVVDEAEDLSSPRDSVLKLVKKIKPEIFIHGIINGTYNAPFFVSRFREALYYYSTMFDMVEEIAAAAAANCSEDVSAAEAERMVLEENIYGKEIMNVVACEGFERVERPESYKQWQARNLRAGLKQVCLDQEMIKCAKKHVKLNYHKDFLVDEDKNWMLQGWKGRILFALSFWRSAN